MNQLMENKKQSTKKKIRVRKSSVSPIVSGSRIDEDYYIPVAAYDSTWSGISFKEPKKINIEHAQGITDEETEIKVIDCDFDNEEVTPPLLLLFPDLRKEDSQVQMPIIKDQISTTSLTKMLMGKKPRMSLLKSCKKPIQHQGKLSRVEEDTESDDSIKVVAKRKNKKKPANDRSNFADISRNGVTSTAPNFTSNKIKETTFTKNDTKKEDVSNNFEIKLAKNNENETTEIVGMESRPTQKDNSSDDADISSEAILNDQNHPKNRRKRYHQVNKHEESEESINCLKVELKESREEVLDDGQYRSRGVGTSNASVGKLDEESKPAEKINYLHEKSN